MGREGIQADISGRGSIKSENMEDERDQFSSVRCSLVSDSL